MATAKKPAAKKTAAKKTTAKPAAKKTTAAKSTTKKATTTKTIAKKTTTAKTATKKVAAKTSTKTVVTKKAVEISVTGNKKIDTLRKEFNKQFPYLRLGLYYSYMRNESTKTPLSGDKTLASVRRADSGGDISIAGNKKIKTLEKEFDTVFGLYAQVCYTTGEGKRYYTSGSDDDKTLAAFNAECEKDGCKKGEYK
jgi:septal ring factor EnvC (AmiA/AmiB activator)